MKGYFKNPAPRYEAFCAAGGWGGVNFFCFFFPPPILFFFFFPRGPGGICAFLQNTPMATCRLADRRPKDIIFRAVEKHFFHEVRAALFDGPPRC